MRTAPLTASIVLAFTAEGHAPQRSQDSLCAGLAEGAPTED